MSTRMRRLPLSIALALVLGASPAAAQDLGHRLIGTQGLTAGRQPGAGLYVADQLAFYGARTARDRDGAPLPIDGLQIEALANGVGASLVVELPLPRTFLTVTAAAPLAHVSVSSDRPEVSLDRAGLGDVFVQPLRLGWSGEHVDVVAGYALYVPTGLFELGASNVSSGQYTHEWSLGTSVSLDAERHLYASALASYDLYHPKLGLDLTRGDTVQIQGGVGTSLFRLVDLGVVGAALWQVRDDRGADLPPVLQGARERAYALGGELGIALPSILGRISARYEHELEVRARPEGQILVLQLAMAAWQPPAPETPGVPSEEGAPLTR